MDNSFIELPGNVSVCKPMTLNKVSCILYLDEDGLKMIQRQVKNNTGLRSIKLKVSYGVLGGSQPGVHNDFQIVGNLHLVRCSLSCHSFAWYDG